jgi:hypothetical protein
MNSWYRPNPWVGLSECFAAMGLVRLAWKLHDIKRWLFQHDWIAL